MGTIRISTEERRDIFLYNTRVENLFINEFLPDAPGDCVKVFLFGLMYAQYEQPVDTRTMALTLGLDEREVENAWKYWEAKGLVRLGTGSGGSIEEITFIRQIDLFYGKTLEDAYPGYRRDTAGGAEHAAEGAGSVETDDAAEADESAAAIIDRLIDRQLTEIFAKYESETGRTLSPHEAAKLRDAVRIYNIEPDVLDFAITYCVGIDKTSVDYICKVALRWTEDGARDVFAVKSMLDKRSKRNDAYRKIFAQIGFNRLPNPSDREIMDRWFDELGCSLEEVLDACRKAGGMREPHLRYIDKVIENRILEKGGINTRANAAVTAAPAVQVQTQAPKPAETARVSRKVLADYYEYLRAEEEKSHKSRIAEVTDRYPEMRELFAAEIQVNSQMIAMKPGPDARERRQELRDRRLQIEQRKKEILREAGYPEDYLARQYKCSVCRDTGYTDEGRICTCARARAEEAYEWIQKTTNS